MRKLFCVIAMGCLLSLLVVGSVQAQLPGSEIRASIPFDFTVRGKTLPAGDYAITRIGDEPRRNFLVFNRYGDSYFLEEVVTAGEGTGRELSPSHAERALRREMAKNQLQPETVTVALN